MQLGDVLGISRPQLASDEVGRRRVPVSMLPGLAYALTVPIVESISEDGSRFALGGRGPVRASSNNWNRFNTCPKRSSVSSYRCSTLCSDTLRRERRDGRFRG
jgi:hypothetical protein